MSYPPPQPEQPYGGYQPPQPEQPYGGYPAKPDQPYGGYPQQQQPYGYPAAHPGVPQYDPATGLPLSDKTKLVAGLLQILAGSFGAGRFYTGHVGMAIGQIAVTWLTCGIGVIWPIVDGIMILINGGTDAQGRKLRDQ
ncbi:MAG TPA: TM2 domain-containing protein [Cryptosporangiaceae bacterium]|nr:TM2 domain-containing protein [Cryptosporangiaceae bacterium]